MEQRAQSQPKGSPSRKRKVPDYLVRDLIDGVPYYYPGFRQVLSKKKTFEEIMGWSGLQGFIVQYFTFHILNQLSLKKYVIFPGETGNHLGYRNNLSLDLAIFEKRTLTPDKIVDKYLDVPAHCVIEIDVQAEIEGDKPVSEMGFIGLKTQKLFDFGTKRLIWVLSKSKKVIVAENGKHWEIIDWNEDIELLDGVTFNVGKYLESEGVNTDGDEVRPSNT